jgi:RNA polymerase sigma-70 factor, ECF subfamily
MSIEKLFIQCKKRDFKAQEALYKSFSKKMYMHCYRYLKNKEDAEDVLAEGFVKVFQHLPTIEYQGDAAFEAWLKKIMVNESLGALRKKKDVVFYEHSDATDSVQDYHPLAELRASEIYHMITTLPTGLRTIFNLYAIEGYAHAEIAEMLGITESTSRTQLMKARRALQEQLNQTPERHGS